MFGAVKVLDRPGAMSPVLNFPSMAVTVWATWSWLVTVTVAPGATVTALGEKEKSLMVMASAVAPPVGEPPVVVDPAAMPVVVVTAPPAEEGGGEEDEAVLPPDEQAARLSPVATRTTAVSARIVGRRRPRPGPADGSGRFWVGFTFIAVSSEWTAIRMRPTVPTLAAPSDSSTRPTGNEYSPC